MIYFQAGSGAQPQPPTVLRYWDANLSLLEAQFLGIYSTLTCHLRVTKLVLTLYISNDIGLKFGGLAFCK